MKRWVTGLGVAGLVFASLAAWLWALGDYPLALTFGVLAWVALGGALGLAWSAGVASLEWEA